MAEVKAKLRYLRQTPRKTRLIADLVRGVKVEEAEKQLDFSPKRSAMSLLRLLRSAVSNAKNNFQLDKENLYIKEIRIDKGPILKRYRPRARGRATMIKKRTSHVTLVLGEKEKEQVKTKE